METSTERTARKISSIGRSAHRACQEQGKHLGAGLLFRHEGVLYRVTGNNVGGLHAYFSYEPVSPGALVFVTGSRKATIAEYLKSIGRALGEAGAPERLPMPEVPVAFASPGNVAHPFKFPLNDTPCDCGCKDTEAERTEVEKLHTALLQSEANAMNLETRIRALEQEVQNAREKEGAHRARAEAADKTAKACRDRADGFERELTSIYEICRKSDIIPF